MKCPKWTVSHLLEAFDESKIPAVIFVTAYDQYAVKAFEVSAVDYLLKPFDHERMATALQRAKTNLREKTDEDRNDSIIELLQQINAKRKYSTVLSSNKTVACF